MEGKLGGRLKLNVAFKGQTASYRKDLVKLFQGSGVTKDAIERLVAPESTDGYDLAQTVRGDIDEMMKKFGLTKGMATKVVNWIRSELFSKVVDWRNEKGGVSFRVVS